VTRTARAGTSGIAGAGRWFYLTGGESDFEAHMPFGSRPHWANNLYWGVTYRQAESGLLPKQAELQRGTRLYRFINLNRGWVEGAADGPWWLEPRQLEALQGFAMRNRRPLHRCARMLASIHDEYDEVNALVWAQVAPGPLLAWKGPAKLAPEEHVQPESEAEPESDEQADAVEERLDIVQVFIPGLGSPYRQFSSFMRFLGAGRLDMEWPVKQRRQARVVV
jgi:hypothetical protein